MNLEFLPIINSIKCIGCELCVQKCPYDVLTMQANIAIVSNPAKCSYDGVCQDICPTQAISLVYEIVFHKKDI